MLDRINFKRWDGVKDEKFKYEDSLKTPIFGGGFHAKPIYRGELRKKGGGGGAWRKRECGVFRGVDTPMHTVVN